MKKKKNTNFFLVQLKKKKIELSLKTCTVVAASCCIEAFLQQEHGGCSNHPTRAPVDCPASVEFSSAKKPVNQP